MLALTQRRHPAKPQNTGLGAGPKAPLWRGELAQSVHMLSPRQALMCLRPKTIYEAAQHVYVYFVPGQDAVPTVQKVGSKSWVVVLIERDKIIRH